MASGEFLELAQRACYQARFRPENTDDLTRAKEAINECYMSVIHMGDRFSFLEKEVVFTIDSAADVYSLTSIAVAAGSATAQDVYQFTNDTDGGKVLEPLDWLSLENSSNSSQDNDPRGSPYAVAKWDDRIRFYPWPDREYEIGCLFLEGDTELSGDTDTPLIPLAWRHRILVPYAAMRLWEQQSGGESLNHANYYRAQYERDIQLLRERYASARMATLGLDSPGFSADLPGSVTTDFGFYDVDY